MKDYREFRRAHKSSISNGRFSMTLAELDAAEKFRRPQHGDRWGGWYLKLGPPPAWITDASTATVFC